MLQRWRDVSATARGPLPNSARGSRGSGACGMARWLYRSVTRNDGEDWPSVPIVIAPTAPGLTRKWSDFPSASDRLVETVSVTFLFPPAPYSSFASPERLLRAQFDPRVCVVSRRPLRDVLQVSSDRRRIVSIKGRRNKGWRKLKIYIYIYFYFFQWMMTWRGPKSHFDGELTSEDSRAPEAAHCQLPLVDRIQELTLLTFCVGVHHEREGRKRAGAERTGTSLSLKPLFIPFL